MMFRKNKIEVVQPREYSHAEVLAYMGGRSVCEKQKSSINTTVSNNLIPPLAMASLFFSKSVSAAPTSGEWAVQTAPAAVVPTGVIADKSLEMLATILDPVVQILVAISFPVASVIMIGACFFFMFGKSEKAWETIMNAGLGYVLIQISPLFLEILRQVGGAI